VIFTPAFILLPAKEDTMIEIIAYGMIALPALGIRKLAARLNRTRARVTISSEQTILESN
jgi:hypothetical protein